MARQDLDRTGDTHPPPPPPPAFVNRQTENIAFPRTSYASGNNEAVWSCFTVTHFKRKKLEEKNTMETLLLCYFCMELQREVKIAAVITLINTSRSLRSTFGAGLL